MHTQSLEYHFSTLVINRNIRDTTTESTCTREENKYAFKVVGAPSVVPVDVSPDSGESDMEPLAGDENDGAGEC